MPLYVRVRYNVDITLKISNTEKTCYFFSYGHRRKNIYIINIEIYSLMLPFVPRIEEKLQKNMSNEPDDECEAWLLGSGETFSAVDISLGVILNRLALLGMRYIFWEGTEIMALNFV